MALSYEDEFIKVDAWMALVCATLPKACDITTILDHTTIQKNRYVYDKK